MSVLPCCASVSPVPAARRIRLSRRLWAVMVARILHGSTILRGNGAGAAKVRYEAMGRPRVRESAAKAATPAIGISELLVERKQAMDLQLSGSKALVTRASR